MSKQQVENNSFCDHCEEWTDTLELISTGEYVCPPCWNLFMTDRAHDMTKGAEEDAANDAT